MTALLGSEGNPFTFGAQGDRRRMFCQCARCKIVDRCTPNNDFYTTPRMGDDLVCRGCMLALANGEPITITPRVRS